MDEVRVALAGIGGYGAGYAEELLQPSTPHSARFVAGIDPMPQLSPVYDALRQAGIPVFEDLESFYAADMADLVVISAPIHWHAPLTLQALAHGSNVLVEKPLAATLEEARGMGEAAARAGRFVAVGYQWSFTPAVQALKEDIQRGALGRPLRLKTKLLWPRAASYYRRSAWAGRIRLDDGRWVLDSPVNNAGAHYLHNMLYILGECRVESAHPVDVQAELYRANPIENYDTAALSCHTHDGCEILYYATHAVNDEVGPVFRGEFEGGTVEFSPENGRNFVFHARVGRTRSYGSPDDEGCPWMKLWQSVEAVRGGGEVACGIGAALGQTLIVNSVQASCGIEDFPKEMVRRDERGDGDSLTWVEGLGADLERCYEEGILPSEDAGIRWARGGKMVDLRNFEGYSSMEE